jgi:hypothetical protein
MPIPKPDLQRRFYATDRFQYTVQNKLEMPDFFPMKTRMDSFKLDKLLAPSPYYLAIVTRINGIKIRIIFDLGTSV